MIPHPFSSSKIEKTLMLESHLQQTDELIQTSQALPYRYDRPPDARRHYLWMINHSEVTATLEECSRVNFESLEIEIDGSRSLDFSPCLMLHIVAQGVAAQRS